MKQIEEPILPPLTGPGEPPVVGELKVLTASEYVVLRAISRANGMSKKDVEDIPFYDGTEAYKLRYMHGMLHVTDDGQVLVTGRALAAIEAFRHIVGIENL